MEDRKFLPNSGPGSKWAFLSNIYSIDFLHSLTSLTWFAKCWEMCRDGLVMAPIHNRSLSKLSASDTTILVNSHQSPTSSCVQYSRWRSRKDISAHLATLALSATGKEWFLVMFLLSLPPFMPLVVCKLFEFRSQQPVHSELLTLASQSAESMPWWEFFTRRSQGKNNNHA